MPRRAMKALRGGETERLTQNYWLLRSIVLDKNNIDVDLWECRLNLVPQLTEDELAYAYWEFMYARARQTQIKENMRLMKEYLLSEYMDRKYGRNAYKEGGDGRIKNQKWTQTYL